MIRNLKALGLALVALLALSAMAASTASAQEGTKGELTTEGGQAVTLTGTENEAGTNALTSFGGSAIECPGSTYTGHRVISHEETEEGAKHQFLQPGDTTFTVTPHYVNCQASGPLGGPFPMTVDMTGCDYVFYLGTTTPAHNTEETYGVGVDITCPTGKHIDIDVFSDEEHTENICEIKITPEALEKHPGVLSGLHAADTGDGTPRLHGSIPNIGATNPIHRTGLCTLDGEGTTDKEGEFHADVDLSAHDELGEPVDIAISDENLE